MTDAQPGILVLAAARDPALVGGKAVNLARMIEADLPVPDGFVVTTAAWRRAQAGGGPGVPPDLAAQVAAAYRELGAGRVAVRSSATAEDLAEASMAGQYQTFLDVADEASLLRAVADCWASLDSPRTRAYLAEHGIDVAHVAMAVVVQRLIPAEAAGVLFTANPRTGRRDEMVVEASWGLGEAVVSGLVQPDRFVVDRRTGRLTERAIADKHMLVRPADGAHAETDEARRTQPCLAEGDLAALCDLAGRCEAHFGRPQDVEWALHAGRPWLLQSRAITSLTDADAVAAARQAAQDELRRLAAQGRGPWVLHNLAETLPQPTPLTWSAIRRFMSGDGGFGRMYRMAGFEPSERVRRDGFLHLVAGRVYMDAAAGPEMLMKGFPFRYDAALLRASPDAAQHPPGVPVGGPVAQLRAARRMAAAARRLHALARGLDRRLDDEIAPAFEAWCRREKARDLAALSDEALLALWTEREQRVLDEFAPLSLLPTLIAGLALDELRTLLSESFWDRDAEELARGVGAFEAPDRTVAASADLYDVAHGRRELASWLAEHGHRAPGEFDLASPRWRERPEELRRMASHLAQGADPRRLHEERWRRACRLLEELRSRLADGDRRELDRRVALVRRYMPFRENAKHWLMLGYDLLREAALEAGRRLGVGEDVFLLTFEELRAALPSRTAPREAIEHRKAERRAAARLSPPPVIEAASIETMFDPQPVATGRRITGFAVSTGTAGGPARIVRSPEAAGDLGTGYVLVCASTDPGWTPLFVNASALVLERGGTLSHGAVVAREMGIPAIVVPGAMALLTDGEPVTVDGHAGILVRDVGGQPADPSAEDRPAEPGPDEVRIAPELTPPPAGRRERTAARRRNVCLLIWAAFLAAAFALPEPWLYRPAIRALDGLIWPLVPAVGKPLTVALVAGAMAGILLLLQRVLTDNRRLLEAKRRAALLRRQAAALPPASPRRLAMQCLAAPVQMRIVGAALVPLAAVLGPMLMVFFWFPARLDPASWNSPPGTDVTVRAYVHSDFRRPVRLTVPAPLAVDPYSPNPRELSPIREALERLRWAIRDANRLDDVPPAARGIIEGDPEAAIEALRAQLAEGLPPQAVTWRVIAPNKAAGRFPLTVSGGNAPPLTVEVVLGDDRPPAPKEATGPDNSSLLSVQVVYPPPEQKRLFWAPLAWAGLHWDAGWLVVYLLAYLPAMFLFRRLLGCP